MLIMLPKATPSLPSLSSGGIGMGWPGSSFDLAGWVGAWSYLRDSSSNCSSLSRSDEYLFSVASMSSSLIFISPLRRCQ